MAERQLSEGARPNLSSVFFFHPRPARNIASIPSRGGLRVQDNSAVAPSNFVPLFSVKLRGTTERTRRLRGGIVKLGRAVLRDSEGGPSGQDYSAVAPSNFVALF